MKCDIINVNYRCVFNRNRSRARRFLRRKVSFRKYAPMQGVVMLNGCKLILFRDSNNARIMGCKQLFTCEQVAQLVPRQIKAKHIAVQTCTLRITFDESIRLSELHNKLTSRQSIYEPELFPAMRLRGFNPMCVNVFHTGKCIITGYRPPANSMMTLEEDMYNLARTIHDLLFA